MGDTRWLDDGRSHVIERERERKAIVTSRLEERESGRLRMSGRRENGPFGLRVVKFSGVYSALSSSLLLL